MISEFHIKFASSLILLQLIFSLSDIEVVFVCICIGDAHRLGHKQVCQVTSKTKTIREVKHVPCWNDNADTATSCTSDGIGKFFS